MSKHLVLCVETTHQAKTDQAYIDKTLKAFYKINADVKLTYCNINGKGNYNKKNLLKQIKENINQSPADEKYVIYLIDTDNFESNPEDRQLNMRIEQFCNENSYKLVWFCRNIEEVYWHKTYHEKEKLNAVKKFNSGDSLQKATEFSLSATSYSKKKSNILKVLDEILIRKI